jgi:hypothetical protein
MKRIKDASSWRSEPLGFGFLPVCVGPQTSRTVDGPGEGLLPTAGHPTTTTLQTHRRLHPLHRGGEYNTRLNCCDCVSVSQQMHMLRGAALCWLVQQKCVCTCMCTCVCTCVFVYLTVPPGLPSSEARRVQLTRRKPTVASTRRGFSS